MFGAAIMARLGLDTAGFKSELASTHSRLLNFGRSAAGIFGVSLGVTGLTQLITSIVEYGDRVQDLSERHNVNAESLQRVGNAAALAGSSMEEVGKGLKFIEKNGELALRGNEKLLHSFDRLGISADDLRKLSPEQILLKIGKSGMSAADMLAVLGKEGLNLRPVLKGIADGTIELGDAIDAVDIKKLDEASDAWKKLWQGLVIKSGTMLSQDMKDLEAFGGLVKKITDGIKANWEGIFASDEALDEALAAAAAAEKQGLGPTYEKLREQERLRKEEADRPAPKSKSQLAAESKERDRNKLSLNQLAERPEEVTSGSNAALRARYAGIQAREVQNLYAQADQMTRDFEFEAADRLRGRADQMKIGLGESGVLKESEFKTALALTEETLKRIEEKVTFQEQ